MQKTARMWGRGVLAAAFLIYPLSAEATYTPVTVEESDGSPSVKEIATIKVSNGTLTDNGDGSVTLVNSGGSGTVNTGATGYFAYYPGAGTTVDDQTLIYTDGTNVGVGTATPNLGKLHVHSSGPALSVTSTGGNGSDAAITAGANWGSGIESRSAHGTSGYFISSDSSNTAPTLVTEQQSSSTADLFQAQNASGTSLVKITSTGNVGIGTATASNPFSVYTANGFFYHDGYSIFRIASGVGSTYLELDSNSSSNPVGIIAGLNGTKINLGDQNSTTMTLDTASDNVGIGTIAPTSVLELEQSADSTNVATPVMLDVDSVGAAGELTASSGTQVFSRIAPTVNQSSTAGYTAFLVNATETATGSGSKLLADFQTGGSSKVIVQSDGNVGIGTTAPVALLDVNGKLIVRPAALSNINNFTNINAGNVASSTQMNPGLLFYANGTDVYGMDLGYNTASTPNYRTRLFTSSYDIAFSSTGGNSPTGQSSFTELMTIKNGGSVGIGTVNPGALLHVQAANTSDTVVTEALRLSHIDTASSSGGQNGIGASLSFTSESDSDTVYPEIGRVEAAMTDVANASKDSSLKFYTLGPNAGAGSNTATIKMTLDNSGNLGIGSATPATKLVVEGDISIIESGSSPTYHTILHGGDQAGDITYTLPTASSNGVLTNTSGTLSWAAGGGSGTVNTGATGYFAYYPGNGTTVDDQTALYMNASGNIGVGTSNPTAKLDVRGPGAADGELRIQSGGAYDADLVFNVNGTNTYSIYSSTDGSFRINDNVASLTDRLTIISGGNVGIGSTAPVSPLDVNGATFTPAVGGSASIAHVQGAITEAGSGTHALLAGLYVDPPTITGAAATVTQTASLYIPNAPTATVSGTNYALYSASGANRMGGTLSVGTSAVTSQFQTLYSSTLTGASSETGNLLNLSDTGVVSTGTDTTIGTQISATRTGASGGTINTTALNVTGTGDTGGTSTMTGLAVSVSGADTNYAATFSGGRVGIGTTSPKETFQVDGTGAAISIGGIDGGSGGPAIGFNLYSDASNDRYIVSDSAFEIWHDLNNDKLIFAAAAPGTAGNTITTSTGISIDSFAKVGIGTDTPSNKLHVQGTGGGAAGIYLNSAVPGTATNTLYNSSGTLYFNGSPVGGGSTRLDQITAANDTTVSINHANTTTNTTWNWNSLSSGTGLALASSADFTGTLFSITNSGNSATNDGVTMKITSSGTANQDVPLMVTNLSDVDSFRVNDQTGDSDSTPFVITKDGNVGIGTTAPGANFVVYGSGTTSEFVGASTFRIDPASTAFIGTSTSSDLNIGTATSATISLINSSGFVGIWDATPDYQLEIYDSTNTPTFAMSDDDVAHGLTGVVQTDVFAHLTSLSTTAGGLQLTGLSDTDAKAMSLRGYIGSTDPTDTIPAVELIGAKKNTTAVQALGNLETVLQVANNTSALMTVLGNGNVGIGTSVTNPDVALRVEGAAGNYIFKVADASGTNGTLAAYVSNTPRVWLGTTGAVRLGLGTGGNNNEHLVINSGGNVAVGTTNAVSKLHVNTSGISINAGDVTSDYSAVFSNTAGTSASKNAGIAILGGGTSNLGRSYILMGSGGNVDGDNDFNHIESNYSTGTGTDDDPSTYLNFQVADSVKLAIRGNGNVGIGSTAPRAKLDLGAGQILIPTGTSDTGTIGGAMYYNTSTTKFRCYQGSWMDCIGAGGSPTLDSVGAAAGAATRNHAANEIDWQWNSLAAGNGLELSTSADFTGTLLQLTNSNNSATNDGVTMKITNSGSTNQDVPLMVTQASDAAAFRVNDDGTDTDSTPFIIAKDGNVGIGTSAPAWPLDIVADMGGDTNDLARLQNTSASGYSSIAIYDNSGAQTAAFGYGNASTSISEMQSRAFFWTHTGVDFIISNFGGGFTNFDSSGNVGIGVINPQNMLDIYKATGGGLIQIAAPDTQDKDIYWTDDTSDEVWSWSHRKDSEANRFELYYNNGTPTYSWNGPYVSVQTNGNVGIGSSTPRAKLDLGAGQILIPTGTSDTGTIAGSMYYNTSTTKFRCYQGGWTDCIPSGGTTTLTGIQAATNSTVSINHANTNTTTTWNWNSLSSGTGLALASSADFTGNIFSITNSGNSATNDGVTMKITSSGTTNQDIGLMVTQGSDAIAFQVNDDGTDSDSTPFIIMKDGKVGIGTTAAQSGAMLTVQQDNTQYPAIVYGSNNSELGYRTVNFTTTGRTAYNMLNDNSDQGTLYLTGSADTSGAGASSLNLDMAGNHPMAFFTNSAERMRIKGDGNVGIGSTNPANKLDVGGTIATSSTIELGNASDTTLSRTAAGKIAVEGKGLITQVKTTVLTSGSGSTFTPTTGAVYFEVWVTGQGGGGGGADNGDTSATAAAGGGGAGGTAYIVYDTTEMGANAVYTVGTAAGAGGANTGGNGTAGTDSTFNPAGTGATLTGTGGALGTGMTNSTPAITITAAGAGSGATNGSLNLTGGGGVYGFTGSTATTGPAMGGQGGNSYWGGSAAPAALAGAACTAGPNGAAYGAGGGGAVCINTTAGAVGGNGGGGVIVVTEYIA